MRRFNQNQEEGRKEGVLQKCTQLREVYRADDDSVRGKKLDQHLQKTRPSHMTLLLLPGCMHSAPIAEVSLELRHSECRVSVCV